MHPLSSIVRACLLFSLGVFAQDNSTTATAASKPNIVFILTDDQDMRMNSLEHMPQVQKLLMQQRTTYMRHYAPTAFCCPARVSLLTGQLAHNHGITQVGGAYGGWHKIIDGGINDNYLPIWLQAAGYKTYYTGKLYNGMDKGAVEKKTARGWTKADLLVTENTYQYFNPAFQHIEGGNWKNPEKVTFHPGKYNTDMVADSGYSYLKEAVAKPDPFFVGIAPVTPHTQIAPNAGPAVPAKKYEGTMAGLKVPRTANFNPADRSGVNFVWKSDQLNNKQVGELDTHYQARTEALLSVDDMVAEVVKILRDAKKLDNTYIIYSSDNGFHLGHHRLSAGKKYAFEEDVNVPLIIRGPNTPKNRKTELVTAHVDFSPTVLKLAGIPQRAEFDGKPIPVTAAEIQNQEGGQAEDYTNLEFWAGVSYKWQEWGKGKETFVNSFKSVRIAGKGYNLMYAVHCKDHSHELYDMDSDPVQMRNLHPKAPAEPGKQNAFDAGTKTLAGFKIPALLQRVDALLLVLKTCKGKECRKPWAELHPGGAVENLRGAMDAKWDDKYNNIPPVKFVRCFNDGRINLAAEGVLWGPNGPTNPGQSKRFAWTSEEGFDPLQSDEGMETIQGFDAEGYVDDWE